MKEFVVIVSIRKGLGPEWIEKHFPVAFDDIDDDVSEYELKQWASWEVEKILHNSEDFAVYGKNWVIEEVETV
jgi:hypothetical protein